MPAHMQRHGWRIIPVNPHADEILGERVYRTLAEVPDEVGLVDVFRPAWQAADIARQAVAAGATAVWLQLGIASAAARAIAADAGLLYVEDRCLLVEQRRLGLAGTWPADHRLTGHRVPERYFLRRCPGGTRHRRLCSYGSSNNHNRTYVRTRDHFDIRICRERCVAGASSSASTGSGSVQGVILNQPTRSRPTRSAWMTVIARPMSGARSASTSA